MPEGRGEVTEGVTELIVPCRYCQWRATESGPWTDVEDILGAAHRLKSAVVAHVARHHPDERQDGVGAGVDRLIDLTRPRPE